jgi:hypothetical protein
MLPHLILVDGGASHIDQQRVLVSKFATVHFPGPIPVRVRVPPREEWVPDEQYGERGHLWTSLCWRV